MACDQREQARGTSGRARSQVSELTTNRLSVYLRCLNALEAAGVRTISSQALAEQFHLNAAQIRKDLAYFGEFGVRGVGYYVTRTAAAPAADSRTRSRRARGDHGRRQPGLALADYAGFRDEGFEIVALFDTSGRRSGSDRAAASPIHDIRDFKKVVRRERHRDRGHRRAGSVRPARRQHGRGGRRQGSAQLLARRDQGAART